MCHRPRMTSRRGQWKQGADGGKGDGRGKGGWNRATDSPRATGCCPASSTAENARALLFQVAVKDSDKVGTLQVCWKGHPGHQLHTLVPRQSEYCLKQMWPTSVSTFCSIPVHCRPQLLKRKTSPNCLAPTHYRLTAFLLSCPSGRWEQFISFFSVAEFCTCKEHNLVSQKLNHSSLLDRCLLIFLSPLVSRPFLTCSPLFPIGKILAQVVQEQRRETTRSHPASHHTPHKIVAFRE